MCLFSHIIVCISLVITEVIMDFHQRIDSIKMTVLSVVLSDSTKLVCAFQQIIKEICISNFSI